MRGVRHEDASARHITQADYIKRIPNQSKKAYRKVIVIARDPIDGVP